MSDWSNAEKDLPKIELSKSALGYKGKKLHELSPKALQQVKAHAESPARVHDDQDGGQFGRDARKHLRTTDQAAMKRTAMDVKPGQMRLPGLDAATKTPEAHAKSAKYFGELVTSAISKHSHVEPEGVGSLATKAASHGKKALGQDESDAADSEGGHGEHEEPSHYEAAMSRKTGASVGQLRKEQAAAEKTGYMNRVSPGTRRPSGNPKP